MTQVGEIQLYSGQRLYGYCGSCYFINKQYVVQLADNGQQQIVYAHECPIDSVCFHEESHCLYFTQGTKLYVYNI